MALFACEGANSASLSNTHAHRHRSSVSLRRPHPLPHTRAIIFSMFPSSSNLTVMAQQGLEVDLPSGLGCSLKYLPCSHFNPHLNTSSILGHYRESVCPACLSLRLVCVCVCVCQSDTVRMDAIVPGGSRWPLRAAACSRFAPFCVKKKIYKKHGGCRNHCDRLLFLSSSSSLFMIVPSVFYLYHWAASPSSFKAHRKEKADHLFQ